MEGKTEVQILEELIGIKKYLSIIDGDVLAEHIIGNFTEETHQRYRLEHPTFYKYYDIEPDEYLKGILKILGGKNDSFLEYLLKKLSDTYYSSIYTPLDTKETEEWLSQRKTDIKNIYSKKEHIKWLIYKLFNYEPHKINNFEDTIKRILCPEEQINLYRFHSYGLCYEITYDKEGHRCKNINLISPSNNSFEQRRTNKVTISTLQNKATVQIPREISHDLIGRCSINEINEDFFNSLTSFQTETLIVEAPFIKTNWNLWNAKFLKEVEIRGAHDQSYYRSVKGVVFSGNKRELIAFPPAKGDVYEVPNGTLKIRDNAFRNNTALTTLFIPHSVVSIGINAFQGCENLTRVVVDNVKGAIKNEGLWGETNTETNWYWKEYSQKIQVVPNLPSFYENNADCKLMFEGFYYEEFHITIEDQTEDDKEMTTYLSYYLKESLREISELFKSQHPTFKWLVSKIWVFKDQQSKQYAFSLKEKKAYLFNSNKNNKRIVLPDQTFSFWFVPSKDFLKQYRKSNQKVNNFITKPKRRQRFDFEASTDERNNGKLDEEGVLYSEDGKRLFKAPKDLRGSYIVQDGVEIICTSAFYDCKLLTSLQLPDSLKCIGPQAFDGCMNLYDFKLPSNLTNIEREAFEGCISIRELIVPKSVNHIGNNPFTKCKEIEVKCNSSDFVLKDDFLMNKKEMRIISYLGHSEMVNIPFSVEQIGGSAFREISGLKKVFLSTQTKRLYANSFYYCRQLEEFHMSDNVEEINK